VTYRVRFEGHALIQLHGLPTDGFDALLAGWLSWWTRRGTRS
jgi:hypothetical protein